MPRAVALFTHDERQETATAVTRLLEVARDRHVEVRVSAEEMEKHDLGGSTGVALLDPTRLTCDLAVVLGGDGTTLQALRVFSGRAVPVFSFNYGAIGFLATVEESELEDGLRRAFSGDFELLSMPALTVHLDGRRRVAVNDVSLHRRANERVAELAYSVAGEQLAKVRCDGLVASTSTGSTGYNLANGGPVLAWGVSGFVVSFIAPHSLTARPLVVATEDVLQVTNGSPRDDVDVTTDGRIVGSLAPGSSVDMRVEQDQALLAQLPGSTFYHRLKQKFGRLAN